MAEDGVKGNINKGYGVYHKGKLIGYFKRRKDAEDAFQQQIESEAKSLSDSNREVENKMSDEGQQDTGQEGQQNPSGEARGRGGSPINVSNLITISGKKNFWLYFIITAVVLFVLWYFGLYRYITTALKIEIKPLGIAILLGTFIFIGYIIWGFRYAYKNKDRAAFWVALVLLIWLWDLAPAYIGPIKIPYGGIPFQGYIWNIPGAFSITWLTIITSSVVFAFLYINMLYKIVEHDYPAILVSFLSILILNWLGQKFLPDRFDVILPIPWGYGNLYFVIALLAGILAMYLIYRSVKKHGKYSTIPDFASYLLFSFFFSFFWINRGWMASPKGIAHAIFIVLFGLLYIAKEEPQPPPALWRISTIALLLIDFYGYGLLFSSDILVLQFIPVLVLFVVFYCYGKKKSLYALTTFIVVITIMLVLTVQAAGYYQDSSVPFTPRGGGAELKDFLGTLFGKTQELVTQRLDIATAGLYSGNVEKNRYESLGVYFANLRAADPRFYTDELITLWGTIRSKTYQDAVIVNFSCYRLKGKEKIFADKVIPDTKFPIFSLENVDTECTFFPKKDKQIPPGANPITFSAEYNFGTDAYLKAYFIDRDRFKAYSRENLDPLKEVGIKDRNPAAVFTNGPVEIGMGVGTADGSLITVSEGYVIKPSIGITLSNRKEITDADKKIITRWEGRIKNITELILLVPPGVEIANLETCSLPEENPGFLDCPCSMPFVPYDDVKCKSTCTKTILDPCNEACEGAYKVREGQTSEEKSRAEAEKSQCKKDCVISNDKCGAECEFLFKPEGELTSEGKNLQGSYKGYALDVSSAKFKALSRDVDKHRSFVCRINPTQAVLDETPITTRYFRARARYVYLLENLVQVNVEAAPIKATLTGPETLRNIVSNYRSKKDVYVTANIKEDYVMALAYIESGLRHCCQEAGKTSFKTCVKSDEMKCPSNRIINSGTSVGIMQIRYDTERVKNDVNDRIKRGVCEEGQNVYDYECNVNLGMDILIEKYRSYRNGCKSSAEYISYSNIKKACDECVSSDKVSYDSYKEADAAARGYNGWGCDKRFDRDYVRKVQSAYQKIKDGVIVDETIQNLFSSREGEGMVPDT